LTCLQHILPFKDSRATVFEVSFCQKAAELACEVDGRTIGEAAGDGIGSDRNTGVKFGEASGLAAGSASFAGLDDDVA
jgi:hypothetical protein